MANKLDLACDVLIAGAGPAGCATALGLLNAGVERVMLVHKPLALPFRPGESATPDLSAALAGLGLESDLERLGHRPYHGNLSAWGSSEARVDHFLFRGRGHGWHLDRSAFDAWLPRSAVTRGARLVCPGGVKAIAPAAGGWRVSVQNLGEVDTRVVVDAGGRRSPLLARLGVRRRRLDGLIALAAHAPGAEGMQGLSLVESRDYGWWYAAGLPDGRTLVMLMTDHDIAKARGFHAPEAFLQAWRNTACLAGKVNPPADLPGVCVFASHSGWAERAAGERWIAVGDALMAFDPLTSSGISGAFDDAQAAVPAILGQLSGDSENARGYARRADSTLKRYLAERRQHYGAESRWPESLFWARRQDRNAARADL